VVAVSFARFRIERLPRPVAGWAGACGHRRLAGPPARVLLAFACTVAPCAHPHVPVPSCIPAHVCVRRVHPASVAAPSAWRECALLPGCAVGRAADAARWPVHFTEKAALRQPCNCRAPRFAEGPSRRPQRPRSAPPLQPVLTLHPNVRRALGRLPAAPQRNSKRAVPSLQEKHRPCACAPLKIRAAGQQHSAFTSTQPATQGSPNFATACSTSGRFASPAAQAHHVAASPSSPRAARLGCGSSSRCSAADALLLSTSDAATTAAWRRGRGGMREGMAGSALRTAAHAPTACELPGPHLQARPRRFSDLAHSAVLVVLDRVVIRVLVLRVGFRFRHGYAAVLRHAPVAA
jgi:hypothetical protein